MQVNKIQNQPNFQANFAKDSTTQYVLREVRRSASKNNSVQITDSAFDIIGLIRKDQTLELFFTEDAKIMAAPKPRNIFEALFGKNVLFEQKIMKGDVSDAFVRLTSKISRLW